MQKSQGARKLVQSWAENCNESVGVTRGAFNSSFAKAATIVLRCCGKQRRRSIERDANVIDNESLDQANATKFE
jgi:hypothetical protein